MADSVTTRPRLSHATCRRSRSRVDGVEALQHRDDAVCVRQCVWRLLGQARTLGGRGRRRRGPADRIERRAARTATPSSRRRVDGVPGDARPGPSAAAARGPEPPERRPGAPRRRRRDGGRPATTPRRRGPRAGAVLATSSVPLGNRPRRGPNPLEIEKKTTPGHHSWKRVPSMA